MNNRIKPELLMHLREKASLTRPAWTSEQSTGMFQAFNHRHTVERSRQGMRFKLQRNFFKGK